VLQIAGVLVMAGGLLVESIADWQKAEFKKVNPKGFCNTGLYSWVRYPNYLGEIMVWVGSFLVALPYLNSLVKIAVGLVGLVCIILIMMGSTKRLEISQDERYGKQESYWQFKQTVPVLFPLIPVYSLKDIRVYIE
jgi:steroid 5-alpha reductase family enzyme